MKEKIFLALKTAFAKLGLGDEILSQHATMLAGLGLVTDENIEAIVKAQEDYLSRLQKDNDLRVTTALKKAQDKAKEEMEAKMAEIEKLHKAELEKLKVKNTPTPTPQPQPTGNGNKESDEVKALREFYEQKFAESVKATDALKEQINSIVESSKAQTDLLTAMKQENEQMKAAKAEAERTAFIANTATELGIPEWRVKEGFAIASDASNDTIKAYLTNVATNIKTANIQTRGGLQLTQNGGKATEAEINNLVSQIMK